MENNANGIKYSVTYADNEKKIIKTKKQKIINLYICGIIRYYL